MVVTTREKRYEIRFSNEEFSLLEKAVEKMRAKYPKLVISDYIRFILFEKGADETVQHLPLGETFFDAQSVQICIENSHQEVIVKFFEHTPEGLKLLRSCKIKK